MWGGGRRRDRRWGVQIWRPTTFMRHMTASAPGIVDFLAILEVLRSRHKPQEKVLDLAAMYVQTAVTPRTMNAIAEGHMDVRSWPLCIATLRAPPLLCV